MVTVYFKCPVMFNNFVVDLISSCWDKVPSKRPSFTRIVQILQHLVQVSLLSSRGELPYEIDMDACRLRDFGLKNQWICSLKLHLFDTALWNFFFPMAFWFYVDDWTRFFSIQLSMWLFSACSSRWSLRQSVDLQICYPFSPSRSQRKRSQKIHFFVCKSPKK